VATGEEVLPEKEPKFQIIPIEAMPVRRAKKTEYWLKVFKSIPKGSALVSSEKELGVKAGTIKSMIYDYVKKGWISTGYHVVRRATPEGVQVFIVHDADAKGKEET
jgi:hypothetical protein